MPHAMIKMYEEPSDYAQRGYVAAFFEVDKVFIDMMGKYIDTAKKIKAENDSFYCTDYWNACYDVIHFQSSKFEDDDELNSWAMEMEEELDDEGVIVLTDEQADAVRKFISESSSEHPYPFSIRTDCDMVRVTKDRFSFRCYDKYSEVIKFASPEMSMSEIAAVKCIYENLMESRHE